MPASQHRSLPSKTSIQILHQLLSLDRDPFIVDIGSNPIDGKPEYWPLVEAELSYVLGFEPLENALNLLRKNILHH